LPLRECSLDACYPYPTSTTCASLRENYSGKFALQINRLGIGWQPALPRQVRIDESAALLAGSPP
jgi:hypothetical protein